MIITEIQTYIDNYIRWLKSEITFSQVGEYYEITAPFLDSKNDYLQIYVKQVGNDIYFSDDGDTLLTLESYGFSLTPARKKQLITILNQFGVELHDKELTSIAPASDFPQRKHMFIQAILRVSDLCMTTKARTSSFFLDDVSDFLDSNDIFYSPNILLRGKSGFSHNYEFHIQRTRNMPERLCTVINTPSQTSMNNTLFIWDDTKKERRLESQLIVFLNDAKRIPSGIESGFANYGVKTIPWSQRNNEENINCLSA